MRRSASRRRRIRRRHRRRATSASSAPASRARQRPRCRRCRRRRRRLPRPRRSTNRARPPRRAWHSAPRLLPASSEAGPARRRFAAASLHHDPRRFAVSKYLRAPRAFALALLLAPNAWAASDADLDEIRAQIKELKSSYETRIQALEQRLKEAEAKSSAPAVAIAPAPSSSTSSISAFNPAVSVILQGRYANLSQNPSSFAIHGFAPGGEIGPGRRGFSLGESEIQMFANVDDKFAGNLVVSLSPENTVSVEEAYGLYVGAPYGLAPKFGRFFSGIGYLNEQHQHVWDFIDAPLAYQAFLGGQYSNDGVQVKWVAPSDQFFEIGAEAGNGDGFPGGPRNKNGVGSGALYAHTGGDVGDSNNWRAGVSYLHTRADDTGAARLGIADFVWKWAPNG